MPLPPLRGLSGRGLSRGHPHPASLLAPWLSRGGARTHSTRSLNRWELRKKETLLWSCRNGEKSHFSLS